MAVDYKESTLNLIVPNDLLELPFTVIATARRTTGLRAGLAHYGVGEEDMFFPVWKSRRAFLCCSS